MELYIEKEFLDNLYIEYSDSYIQKIVKKIFSKYGNKRVYIDVEIPDVETFNNLKMENEFFALLCSNDSSPIPIKSFENHLFNKSNFNQTIVFTMKDKSWFDSASNKGALCFFYETYEDKLTDVIDKISFKIDLSDKFNNWDSFSTLKSIGINNITITDNYILSDKSGQEIKDNLAKLLDAIICDDCIVDVKILTKELNPLSNETKHKKEKAKKIHTKLNRILALKKIKISIILNNIMSDFVMHDRNIYSDFFIIDSGQGFNLLPHKASNSQIISESIFDKYTYDRIGRLKSFQSEYLKKLDKLDTVKFKKFPT